MLSTDDEGVARSDITQEYWRAVRTYKLSYKTLKQMVRNSLEYSFLPGASLWSDSTYARYNSACAKARPSAPSAPDGCEVFLNSSQRARAQWNLESSFQAFEKAVH
jgi:hypothetical protein